MKHRTQEEFLQRFAERAAAYAPGWRFDPESPDMGTALALLFAGMHGDILEKKRELPAKWKTEFFRSLGTCVKPEEPAEGFASFKLVNGEVDGVELPAGTALTSGAEGDSREPIQVETQDDLYVSPAMLLSVYESSDRRDQICRVFEADDESGKGQGSFPFLGFSGKNIQRHEWYIGCGSVFPAKLGEEVELTLFSGKGQPVGRELLELLLNRAEFSFSSGEREEEGFTPFESRFLRGDSLVFVKGAGQPAWRAMELSGEENCWLRCRFPDGRQFERLSLYDVRAASEGSLLAPESIYGAGIDAGGKSQYFPFGEQPSIYDEVYFCCEEALRKKGAGVRLSFLRDFVRVPISLAEAAQIDWKLIMPRSFVKVEREYDITVSRVIWEYFNGNGWVSLFSERRYEDAFGVEGGTHRRRVVLSFTCPEDLAPAMVNGAERYAVRARILKLDNAFKTLGQFITPVLSETSFDYSYGGEGICPEQFISRNNCGEEKISAGEALLSPLGYRPVQLCGDRKEAVYLGFHRPFDRGPARLLAVLGGSAGPAWGDGEEMKTGSAGAAASGAGREGGAENAFSGAGSARRPPLKWEYWGDGRWRPLNPADGTENLRKSGLVSFNAVPDMREKRLFGKSRFWIRIQDVSGEYGRMEKRELPLLRGIHLNCVRAWTVRTGLKEQFTLEGYEAEPVFQLVSRPVHQAQVWVDETDSLSRAETEELLKEGRLRFENGERRQILVLWQQAEDFLGDPGDGRFYTLDSREGVLSFSKSRNFRLPPPGVFGGIQVHISAGGGEKDNLRAHTLEGLERSAGFISQVDNPLPFCGGAGREEPERAMERAAAELKHRFRAVTAGDYERLALEASCMVERAFCFPGMGEDGRRAPGHVTLVLLLKNFEDGDVFFPEIREKVYGYMRDRIFAGLASGGRFHLVKPDFVNIQVSAEIHADSFNEIFSCRKAVEEALAAFLNPVTGNFTKRGFRAGSLPDRKQIEMAIRSAAGVREVRNLIVAGSVGRGTETVDINPGEGAVPYGLPVNGTHQITVKGGTADAAGNQAGYR